MVHSKGENIFPQKRKEAKYPKTSAPHKWKSLSVLIPFILSPPTHSDTLTIRLTVPSAHPSAKHLPMSLRQPHSAGQMICGRPMGEWLIQGHSIENDGREKTRPHPQPLTLNLTPAAENICAALKPKRPEETSPKSADSQPCPVAPKDRKARKLSQASPWVRGARPQAGTAWEQSVPRV